MSVRISGEVLHRLISSALTAVGVDESESEIVAQTLTDANLSGHDSHGARFLSHYVNAIREGKAVSGAKPRVISDTGAGVYLDAALALGPVIARQVVQMAVERAGVHGVTCVSTVNAGYVGRLGGYLADAASSGVLVLMMVNDAGGYPSTAPWGGTQALMSTNPIAAAIPRGKGEPIIIDLATSTGARGKLVLLKNQNAPAPAGWLINSSGEPETDPCAVLDEVQRGAILPLGGLVAGHKGFALSFLVDVLAGALGGSGCSLGSYTHDEQSGIFVLAVSPEHFVSSAQFEASVDQLVERIKSSPKAPGVDEILLPGERSARERQRRKTAGILLDEPTWKDIQQVLSNAGLASAYSVDNGWVVPQSHG